MKRARSPLQTALVGTAVVALTLSACGGGENVSAENEPRPTSTLGQLDGAAVSAPELDMTDINTFKLRPEPLTDTETAWTYLRGELDRLGSTPQVENPAYEFTDKLYASIDPEFAMGAEDFEQLSHNTLVALNLIHANRDAINQNPAVLRAMLQDVYIGVGYGSGLLDDIDNSALVDLFLWLADQIPEDQVGKKFEIDRMVYDVNDTENGGTFATFTVYTNGNGGFQQVSCHTLATPEVATVMNPAGIEESYRPYVQAKDFDGPVHVGF